MWIDRLREKIIKRAKMLMGYLNKFIEILQPDWVIINFVLQAESLIKEDLLAVVH